jgi:hypothetical protein
MGRSGNVSREAAGVVLARSSVFGQSVEGVLEQSKDGLAMLGLLIDSGFLQRAA